MIEVSYNWYAIATATLTNLTLAWLWYGPAFGAAWKKLNKAPKYKHESDKNLDYTIIALLAGIQAFALRHFVVLAEQLYTEYTAVGVGLITGWWVWLGFVATSLCAIYLAARRRKLLLIIDSGFYLVILLINGVILSAWN